MSVYEAGLGSLGEQTQETTFGPADIRLPGNIRDEILTINEAFRVQAKAFAVSAARVPDDVMAAWNGFYREWQAFAANHSSWLSNVWYASYQKALEYRKRLDDWRTKFEQLTGAKLKYPTAGPTAGPPEKPGGFPWKFLLYAGAGVGALYGAARLLSSTTELKREIVGSRHLVQQHGGRP